WSKRTRDYPEPGDVFLLIEVADSSLDFDLGEKRDLYAEAAIREYWVVNLVEQQVDVFRQPREGVYSEHHTYRGNDEIHPVAFPNAVFRPEGVFTD
ncbi:MAG: Uma2 family endonuclease, partial [Pirellulales bacterium]